LKKLREVQKYFVGVFSPIAPTPSWVTGWAKRTTGLGLATHLFVKVHRPMIQHRRTCQVDPVT